MADYLTTDTELTSIANAIRAKGATSALLIYPTGFVSAINAISGGTDVSDTTATASDVLTGKYFYTSAGVRTQGTLTEPPDATGEYFGTPTTIQFQMDWVLYSADVGMTFGQWVESEYNTIGAYINTSTGKVTKPNGYVLSDNYIAEYPLENTIIIESPEYCRYTFNPEGGPI